VGGGGEGDEEQEGDDCVSRHAPLTRTPHSRNLEKVQRGAQVHWTGLVVGLAGCGVFDSAALPPRGEALLVVDTDLPVPQVVSRLRIDITTEDGRPVATRDAVRPDPKDWPTSFSVFSDDENQTRVLLVRLRAYLDARTIDGEPAAALSVDRTVRVELIFARRGRIRVLLKGECLGIPGCGQYPVELEPTLERNVPSVVGTFASVPCKAPAESERICVPGGAFVFGDAFYRPAATASSIDAQPERVVSLSRFVMDEREVSVARFRAAARRGFVAPTPVAASERDGAPGARPDQACTWSAAARDREDYPLSCVTWDTARAFCNFEGGDLPTEAQWEYAALAAGRSAKATYPWGETTPTCDQAVFGRSFLNKDCADRGEGLVPADPASHDTTPLGIRDLAGSLEELVRDDAASFTSACWTGAPRVDPTCTIAPPPECVPDPSTQACRFGQGIRKELRGGSWASNGLGLRLVDRRAALILGGPSLSTVGFRCVYP